MAAVGITPNPPATPREQVRRAWFDAVGLPPPLGEVEAFERDPSDAAWEAMVDRLLAMPAFGERQARHWLDVVRYAQTNGYERDDEKPYAWRYRDWVIDAINDDMPYDRFVREQIAGDLLEPRSDSAVIASGFWHLGLWDDEPDDLRLRPKVGVEHVAAKDLPGGAASVAGERAGAVDVGAGLAYSNACIALCVCADAGEREGQSGQAGGQCLAAEVGVKVHGSDLLKTPAAGADGR
jgi:hypothetical protein